jgi:hypothetical protein
MKQLGNCRLIGVEQLIRPLQTLKSFRQSRDLLIMRLDLALNRSDLVAQPPLERIYRIHLTTVPEGSPPGSCGTSFLGLAPSFDKLAFSSIILKDCCIGANCYPIYTSALSNLAK